MVRKDTPKLKVGNLVLLKNHEKSYHWDAKYMSNFRACKVINNRLYDQQGPFEHTNQASVFSTEHILNLLPNDKAFG